jgi:hypothetical protein
MPWNRRRAYLNEIQWQRTNGALSTAVLELRRELTTKQQYAIGWNSCCTSATSASTSSRASSTS